MTKSDYPTFIAEIARTRKRFLAPSAVKETRNYDTERSNSHPSLSTQRPKGFSRSNIKL